MKKFILAICFIFVCMFSFASCTTSYSMRDVVVRLNDATNSIDIKNYFENGKFEINESDYTNLPADPTRLEILNLAMIPYNNFKDLLQGNVIQKEADKNDSTKLFKALNEFYYALKEMHNIEVLIENNPNFDINNTQNRNEYNQWLSRFITATDKAFEANIALLNTFENALYYRDLNIVVNSQAVPSRTFECKILKAYTIMLKNASTLFLNELENEKLYVYGATASQESIDCLSSIIELGNLLKNKTTLSFNTIALERIKQILPTLTHIYNTDDFTIQSITTFNFTSLANNVRSEYTDYNAVTVTNYINKKLSGENKAHYNFTVQEMQNYKNAASAISNLFY